VLATVQPTGISTSTGIENVPGRSVPSAAGPNSQSLLCTLCLSLSDSRCLVFAALCFAKDVRIALGGLNGISRQWHAGGGLWGIRPAARPIDFRHGEMFLTFISSVHVQAFILLLIGIEDVLIDRLALLLIEFRRVDSR
jgi:hypothetical protein